MDVLEVLSVLEKKGVNIDLECVYEVSFSGKKVLVAYQGIIEIDKEKVCK